MVAGIIVEAAKMIIGGVVGGVTQSIAIDRQIKEYEKAAAEVRQALTTTSGKALLDAQLSNGQKFASNSARQTLGLAASKVKPEGVKTMSHTNNSQNYLQDFDNEMQRTKAIKNADYDIATVRAQNIIGQADKQYTADVNTGEAVTKGFGATADFVKDVAGGASKK